MSTVTCYSCNQDVSPRLWHRNMNSLLFNRQTEHICPLCGETMYVSGGGISQLAIAGLVIGTLFLVGVMVSQLINEISRKPYLLLLATPVALPIMYLLSRRYAKSNKLCLYINCISKWLIILFFSVFLSQVVINITFSILPFSASGLFGLIVWISINGGVLYLLIKKFKSNDVET